MTEPRTEAGRALLASPTVRAVVTVEELLAIEREAIEQAIAEVGDVIGWDDLRVPGLVRRETVLDALQRLLR